MDELLLVKGFTPQAVYDPRYLSENTTATQVTNQGDAQLALADLGTVTAYAPNVTPTGDARTNVNRNGITAQQIAQALNGNTQLAQQIIQNKPGGQAGYTSLGQLLTRVPQAANPATARLVLDNLTTQGLTRLEGRVNFNTASVQVLAALPNVGPDLAQTIVSRQESQPFTKLSDLLDVSTTPGFVQTVANFASVASQSFEVRTVGKVGRTQVALTAVVVIENDAPRILRITEPPYADMPTRWNWTRPHRDDDTSGGELMASKTAHDAVVLWDQEGASLLDESLKPRPVELGSLKGKRVVVLLGRRLTQLRTTELPPAAPEDLRQLVTMRLGELFPVPPSEISFALAPRDAATEGAEPGPTAVYAARHSDLVAIHAAAKASGFTIVATLPASAGSAALAEEMGLPEALIIERDGEGIGLDMVQDLALSLSRRTLGEAGLEGEVRRTFVAAKTGAVPIVATNGFHVPFADRHSPKTGTATLLDSPARWGSLDLVPVEVRVQRATELRRTRMRQGILVLVSGLAVAAYVFKDRSEKAAVVDKATRRANAEVRKYEQVLSLYTSKEAKLSPQKEVLARAFTPAQRTGDLASLIPSLLPDGTWLTNLTFEKGKPMQIRGTALTSANVIAFLKNLGSQKRLRDVRLAFAQTGEIEKKPVANFSITAFPVGNVPLEEKKTRR